MMCSPDESVPPTLTEVNLADPGISRNSKSMEDGGFLGDEQVEHDARGQRKLVLIPQLEDENEARMQAA